MFASDLLEIKRTLYKINYLLRKGKLRAGQKKSLQAHFNALHSYKIEFLHKLNSKKKEKDKALIWKDVYSAFNNRVRTGIIVNLKYIDPKLFLLDCFKLF